MPKIKIDNGTVISNPKKLICPSILVGIFSPIKYEFSLKKLDPAPILNRVDLRDIHLLISKVIEETLKQTNIKTKKSASHPTSEQILNRHQNKKQNPKIFI